ncbi:hydrogenase nickel incorporation protein HypB [Zavarzinia compransoris]|uniref:Hydrogenase maturation factor HypB n=2 Tax=Zavarzinia compransoris TaxID=1264899 RepID=A0A317EA22_9PROT|nr:hydrogenase nickel incorporation protein HypB [Zavarzinia compransoris]PWR23154.1 hydrogenase accessory protein HypB [Zavarzinia compransoris]TDP46289.1 hydrogenase nickel incorporation protein HypB [Zavarzinia compransoris]
MCTVCGCAGDGAKVEGHDHHDHDHGHGHGHGHDHPHDHDHGHHHDHAHGHDHAHNHDHGHTHDHGHNHDYGQGPARAHVPGLSQARMVEIEQGILAVNDGLARRNRERLAARGQFALNFLSSPGSGKTTLLVETLRQWVGRVPVAVVEGDQQTTQDAERIRAAGAPAVQVNTGKGCHLDADMVGRALDTLAPAEGALVFIENVGNLVCPSGFDLGEAKRVTLVSVTEGEDKPLKYPDAFAGADAVLVTKADLLPHLDLDLDRLRANIARVNPAAPVLLVSSRGGPGIGPWLDWLAAARGDWMEELARLADARAAGLRQALALGPA